MLPNNQMGLFVLLVIELVAVGEKCSLNGNRLRNRLHTSHRTVAEVNACATDDRFDHIEIGFQTPANRARFNKLIFVHEMQLTRL